MNKQPQPHEKHLDRLCAAWLFVAFALLAASCAGFPKAIAAAPDDATVYWEASQRLRQGGAELYGNPGLENRVGRYLYPPAFAALFAPLTFLDARAQSAPRPLLERHVDYPLGIHVWSWLQLALLALALWACGPACGLRGREHVRACALAMAVILGAAYIDMDWGNVNLLVLAMVAGGLALAERRREFAGGALIGGAAMIKVLPAILLIVLLLQGRRKAALGVCAGALALWLLPLVWLWPALGMGDGLVQQFTLSIEWVREIALPGMGGAVDFAGSSASPNLSLGAVFARLFTPDARLAMFERGERGPLLFSMGAYGARALALAFTLVMVGAALWLARARRSDVKQRTMAASLALVAVHLGNALCWPYHLVLLALPVCAQKHPVAGAVLVAGVGVPLLLYRAPGYGFLEQAITWGGVTASVVAAFALWAGALWRQREAT